jgi:Fur family transcriptional regulator, ferric uptake regulator
MHISEEQCNAILAKHTVRRTDTRVQILEVFFKHEHALGHSDFKEKSAIRFDDVTLHRTLQTFEQGGIIHEISSEGEPKYVLKHDLLLLDKEYDQQVHFICEVCQQTYVVENIMSYHINYEGKYQVKSVEIIAKGICETCLTNH